MNRSQTIATLLIAATSAFASVAFAQEVDSEDWKVITSTKTRADVQAELFQAQKDGSLKAMNFSGFTPRTASAYSREQVRAELAVARASGELARLNSEALNAEPAPRATAVAGGQR